jgi:hypothetical protein
VADPHLVNVVYAVGGVVSVALIVWAAVVRARPPREKR